jgi:hypothetical protein
MKDLITSKVGQLLTTHHIQGLLQKQPGARLTLTSLAQLLNVEIIIHGEDYTSASTNMEYTTAFEMAC